MANTTTKTAKEEPKGELPAGHPQAGYVGPDLSGITGIETLSEDEQEHYDDQVAAQEEEAETVAEAEDKVVKDLQAEKEKEAKAAEAEAAKSKPTATTAPSSKS